jgi:hypothetical protein
MPIMADSIELALPAGLFFAQLSRSRAGSRRLSGIGGTSSGVIQGRIEIAKPCESDALMERTSDGQR